MRRNNITDSSTPLRNIQNIGALSALVILHGHSAHVVLDTGAGISLLDSSFASRHHLRSTPVSARPAHTVSSQIIHFDRVVDAEVFFLGHRLRGPLFLTKPFGFDALLGTNYLHNTPFVLDFATLRINNPQLPDITAVSLHFISSCRPDQSKILASTDLASVVASTDLASQWLEEGFANTYSLHFSHSDLTLVIAIKALVV